MSLIRRSPVLVGLVAAPFAFAQDAEPPKQDADQPPPDAKVTPIQSDSPVVFRQVRPQQTTPAAQLPPFESMIVRGPNGKIIRIDEQLDLLALHRNVLIDDATRERVRPVLNEWLADLDQLVIDNLDFLEAIEPPDGSPGIIEKIDLNNQATVQPVAQMMNQLISTGPLTAHLQSRGALTQQQADLNQRIISDYLQAVMNEVLAENQVLPSGQEPRSQEERNNQVNTVSRHLYALSARDALSAYHRQMAAAAPHADKVVEATDLSPELVRTLRPKVEAAKIAKTSVEKRKAVRKILDELNFEQRREFLQRALEIVPPVDPLSPPAS